MKKVLLVALLCACGSDEEPGPHDLGPCGDWPALTVKPETCEHACAEQPATFDEGGPFMPCSGHHATGGVVSCGRTYVLDGERGCCAQWLAENERQMIFYVCE